MCYKISRLIYNSAISNNGVDVIKGKEVSSLEKKRRLRKGMKAEREGETDNRFIKWEWNMQFVLEVYHIWNNILGTQHVHHRISYHTEICLLYLKAKSFLLYIEQHA